MKRAWIWAVLLIALVMISACRPTADSLEDGAAAAAEDLGACQPEDDACEVEPAAAETVEESTEPTRETTVEETTGETTPEESAPTDTEVSEGALAGDDPFAIQKTDWVLGPEDAFITMIEYGDFQ